MDDRKKELVPPTDNDEVVEEIIERQLRKYKNKLKRKI